MNPLGFVSLAFQNSSLDLKIWEFVAMRDLKIIYFISLLQLEGTSKLTPLMIIHNGLVHGLARTELASDGPLQESYHQLPWQLNIKF